MKDGHAVDITTDEKHGSITVKGDDAPAVLMELFHDGWLDIDDTPNVVRLEVANTRPTEDDTGEDTEDDTEDDTDDDTEDAPKSNGKTGPIHTPQERDTSHSKRNWTKLTDDDREEADIATESSAHALLTCIHDAGDDGIRPSEIHEANPKMVKGTLSGSLSALWKRMYVERYSTESPDDNRYANRATYYVTNERGEAFLDEHGRYTIGEWVEQ